MAPRAGLEPATTRLESEVTVIYAAIARENNENRNFRCSNQLSYRGKFITYLKSWCPRSESNRRNALV